MNTQSLDLNKMGLAPMDTVEMQEVDGGLWSLMNAVAFGVVVIGSAGLVAGALTGNIPLMVGGATIASMGISSIK